MTHPRPPQFALSGRTNWQSVYYGPPNGPPIEGSAFRGVPPENNIVARNVCVGKWLNVYWHAKKEMIQMGQNFTDSDPLFVARISDSSPIRDFSLQAGSPVWKIGFEKLPVEQIGLQESLRKELRTFTRIVP